MIELRQRQGLLRVVSAALLASYLLVLAMAALPALHRWLHDDADEPGHDCAALAVAHGQIDAPAVGITVPASPGPAANQPDPQLYARKVAPLFLLVSVLEHAPPMQA